MVSILRGSRGIGSRIFRLLFILCLALLLLLLLSVSARGEEQRTVLLRCSGGGWAGSRFGRPCEAAVLPDAASAPHREKAPWGDSFAWYLAEDYPLLVFSLAGCEELAWHCPALP